MPPSIQSYFNFREEITTQDGFLFKGDRLIVLSGYRDEIKVKIHLSHLGIQGCTRRACELVYWPGMYKDIEAYVKLCDVFLCNKFQLDQAKEPLISFDVPDQPWKVIGSDLFEMYDRQGMEFHANLSQTMVLLIIQKNLRTLEKLMVLFMCQVPPDFRKQMANPNMLLNCPRICRRNVKLHRQIPS